MCARVHTCVCVWYPSILGLQLKEPPDTTESSVKDLSVKVYKSRHHRTNFIQRYLEGSVKEKVPLLCQ